MIKDRNGKDLTEAEEVKNMWQEYTKELYKSGHNDLDNYNAMVTNLEPDILGCEVKVVFGRITMNKASGGDDRIPAELFQILKDDGVKLLHSICQQIWKTHQWPQDWKGQFSFQSQRKAMTKNVQTTTQLHSSHRPAMAPHSSTFAWKIPWTEEPGRLQSMGSLESDTTE